DSAQLDHVAMFERVVQTLKRLAAVHHIDERLKCFSRHGKKALAIVNLNARAFTNWLTVNGAVHKQFESSIAWADLGVSLELPKKLLRPRNDAPVFDHVVQVDASESAAQ